MKSPESDIFRRGSTTYYWSSRFFPEPARTDVFRLYSFVRVADNYVDERPFQPDRLRGLHKAWRRHHGDAHFDANPTAADTIDERVLKNLVGVARDHRFDAIWVEDFFGAMASDIHPHPMATLDDALRYVHGSAEVIGLMMARIMGLPAEAMAAAALQGRAMQWINFIRDIDEDLALGRQYLPVEVVSSAGLPELSRTAALDHPDAFRRLIRTELERYQGWQREAARGFHYIPRRYRIPLRTAVDMYDWTARQIAADPFIVFERRVKPTKSRVLSAAMRRMMHA
jgi:phytoene synthase